MPVDHKDVTDGWWYVKDRDGIQPYVIVEVFCKNMVYDNAQDELVQFKKDYIFIAPVPVPIDIEITIHLDDTRDTMTKLRQELNLPVHASASEIFRAALAVAKQAQAEYRDKNP